MAEPHQPATFESEELLAYLNARRGVDAILSGEWIPRERKRAGIRKDARAGMVRSGDIPNARGEHVSRDSRKAAAQRSKNRETLATDAKAA